MSPVSHRRSSWLRGLAILAVVLIHFLAHLPNIYTKPINNEWYIAADQLFRFSVPLFVILSGYGLTRKYVHTHVPVITYLRSRVTKLLPLYLLWSVVSYFLLKLVPAWTTPPDQEKPLLFQLLFGQADYQLYFLPLIFQLYFIFPVLLTLQKKFSTVIVLSALLLQVVFYLWYAGAITQFPDVPRVWQTDRIQYVFALSWIGYFSLGIWLGMHETVPTKIRQTMPWLAIAGAAVLIKEAVTAVSSNIDPIVALKFTRWQVLLYTIPFSLAMLTFSSHRLSPALFKIRTALSWLGKESYLIFLAHTLGLRIIFSFAREEVSVTLLLQATAIWVVAIVISQWLTYKK